MSVMRTIRAVRIKGLSYVAAALVTGGLLSSCAGTAPRTIAEYNPRQAEASNTALLGHVDLQARSAYHPEIKQQGNRWIAYVGHHGGDPKVNPMTGAMEFNGTSVIDVTDPRAPKALSHIPGQQGGTESGGAQMVRICAGKDLPKGDKSKFYLLRSFGNSAHEIWDVTTPEKPVIVSTPVRGLRDTHKNWWECDTGIAYLISGVKGWNSRRMMQIYDLSDPLKPVHIRDFGLVGQEPGSKNPLPDNKYQMHGAISTGVKGNRIYLGSGTNSDGVLQILDREKLLKGAKEPTPENLLYPQVSIMYTPPYMGAHTTLPIMGVEIKDFATNKFSTRDLVALTNEAIANECNEARQMAYFVDVTNDRAPFNLSNYQVPESSGGFCKRGGRFGAHASHENQPPMYAKRVMFYAWFNAGLRAVDMRDPFNPKEIAYYIPAITDNTDKRCVTTPQGAQCKVAIQTNNVDVDDRGYIYIVDRANTGMHIIELTGSARDVANFK